MSLPLFDTDAGVGAGSYMAPSAPRVSVFVLGMIIAADTIDTVAALIEWEGDSIGAFGWRPLCTIVRIIRILVAFFPLETFAAGAIGAAAPLAVIEAEGFVAAGAILCEICAEVATSPMPFPILPLASIISLTVVREEEEEEKEQPAPPCSQH